jgi:hypothetical protein
LTLIYRRTRVVTAAAVEVLMGWLPVGLASASGSVASSRARMGILKAHLHCRGERRGREKVV